MFSSFLCKLPYGSMIFHGEKSVVCQEELRGHLRPLLQCSGPVQGEHRPWATAFRATGFLGFFWESSDSWDSGMANNNRIKVIKSLGKCEPKTWAVDHEF